MVFLCVCVEYTLPSFEKITSLLMLGPQRESSEKSALGLLVVPSLQPRDWRLAALRRGPWKGSLQVGSRLLRESRVQRGGTCLSTPGDQHGCSGVPDGSGVHR